MENKTIKILGVDIHILKKTETELEINKILEGERQCQITTPNPEFLLKAKEDDKFFYVLSRAFLSIPDGTGLKFMGWLKGKNLKIYHGSDLLLYILKLAENKNFKIAILNKKDGLSSKQEIISRLKYLYPNLNVFVKNIDEKNHYPDLSEVNNFKPKIIFCSLGAPDQDIIIYKNFKKIPSAKLAMGIGGSFDFITKKITRAPKILRKLGLEWFWRIIVQPKNKKTRLKRVFNAVIIFPLTFLKYELINPFLYRKNVIGLLINKHNQVLILNSVSSKNYWGLPQGGIENNEKLEDGIRREIKEETNLTNFDIMAKYANIYRYKWHRSYTINNYKGQKQTLFILKYKGDSKELKLNPFEHKEYKWININDLITKSDPIHKRAYELFLKKYRETKI